MLYRMRVHWSEQQEFGDQSMGCSPRGSGASPGLRWHVIEFEFSTRDRSNHLAVRACRRPIRGLAQVHSFGRDAAIRPSRSSRRANRNHALPRTFDGVSPHCLGRCGLSNAAIESAHARATSMGSFPMPAR